MSRVAISDIEMDLTIPSERSITLLAGLFKLSPLELVESTTYPIAKAERLPEIANQYSQLELDLNLLMNDAAWLNRFGDPEHRVNCLNEIIGKWSSYMVDDWILGGSRPNYLVKDETDSKRITIPDYSFAGITI